MYTFKDFHIPERMMSSIKLYINERVEPGGFLTAVIQNNLKEAVGKADEENIGNIPAFIVYFYNEAPAACWGSLENMEAWLKERKEED